MLKKISLTLLILSILLLYYICLSDLYLLDIGGNSKENNYSFLRLLISIYFSILVLLAFRKKYNFYYFFNLLWIIPIIFLFFKTLFGFYNLQKVDYIVGKKIYNYKINEDIYRGLKIKEFIISNKKANDTFYYSESPCCAEKNFTLMELQKNAKISKSYITGYYYILMSQKNLKKIPSQKIDSKNQ